MARTILITGAAGKFGRILLPRFLSAGNTVIAIVRNTKSAESLVDECKIYQDRLYIMVCDLTNQSCFEEIIKKLNFWNIYPDCLINNARNVEYLKVNELGRVDRKNFSLEFLLDVVVAYELTNLLVDEKKGILKTVINIGSQYGTVAVNPMLYPQLRDRAPVHYGVCKAALGHLTKELAVSLAGNGVEVNCIAYGGVDGRVDDAFKINYSRLCPSGRMLNPEEIYGPIDAILSGRLCGMTGHILAIDGGWTIW